MHANCTEIFLCIREKCSTLMNRFYFFLAPYVSEEKEGCEEEEKGDQEKEALVARHSLQYPRNPRVFF